MFVDANVRFFYEKNIMRNEARSDIDWRTLQDSSTLHKIL